MKKRKVLLKGEGVNEHVLVGNFREDGDVLLIDEAEVHHLTPEGLKAEHMALPVEKGSWTVGQQVEYNPLTAQIERVWD